MGTIARVIEDRPNYEIVEVGGTVHYSQEFRVYLMGLSFAERQQVINEIEHQARVRRIVNYKTPVIHLAVDE